MTWLQKLQGQNPSWYKPVIDLLSEHAQATLFQIASSTQPIVASSQLPLFSAWLVRKTGDPRKVLEAATALRDDKRLASARSAFIELDGLAESAPDQFVKKANQVVKELDRTLAAIRTDFHVETPQGGATAALIKCVNMGLELSPWKLPSLPADLFAWRGLESMSQKLRDRYVSPLYRSVVSDLASIARLGDLNEKLKSRVLLEPDASEYLAKVEDVEFRHVTSHWKRPM